MISIILVNTEIGTGIIVEGLNLVDILLGLFLLFGVISNKGVIGSNGAIFNVVRSFKADDRLMPITNVSEVILILNLDILIVVCHIQQSQLLFPQRYQKCQPFGLCSHLQQFAQSQATRVQSSGHSVDLRQLRLCWIQVAIQICHCYHQLLSNNIICRLPLSKRSVSLMF